MDSVETSGQVFVFSGFSFETVLFFGDARFYRDYFCWRRRGAARADSMTAAGVQGPSPEV